MAETLFRFKQFQVSQEHCAMKINTDGVLLGSWVHSSGEKYILDIGTGSGVIAMMLAQRCSEAKIVGVEIDEASCIEARNNMGQCPWSGRLEAINQSIQDYSRSSANKFDLIVSNPPFFSGGTLSATQEKADVRHTTKLSHSDLLRSSYSLLTKDGEFALVLPYIEGLRFIELAEQYRLHNTRFTAVRSFAGKPVERLLLSFSKSDRDYEEDELVIRDSISEFTTEYKNLTKAFYLKF